ncbi:MAG: DUF4399 domain-containing protein [Pseudomonadota bacterium]|nr:DUF4399 domain-containing protein [Pseudomonadota bacterium]|tara:strand:- start:2123 stop:2533 length:411 start_codon:yes stop_codon:yes gene_type:complete
MKKFLLVSLLIFNSVNFYGQNKELYFIEPQDGEKLTNPIRVKFGLSGFGVAPAGVLKENTGHHHLLIDVANLPDFDKPIPATENHIHFGGGQTETVISLAKGPHTLQLLLGDAYHIPLNPVLLSEKITIYVIEQNN